VSQDADLIGVHPCYSCVLVVLLVDSQHHTFNAFPSNLSYSAASVVTTHKQRQDNGFSQQLGTWRQWPRAQRLTCSAKCTTRGDSGC